MQRPVLLGKDSWMRLIIREYRILLRTHEARLQAELTIIHIHDVGATFSGNYYLSVMSADEKVHHISQGDSLIDLCDGLHLVEVNLV